MPFYSFKRGPWYAVFRESPSREVATKDHSSSNPPKGNPPDLKTKVDVSKVDVKGFPTFCDFSRGAKHPHCGLVVGDGDVCDKNRGDLRLRVWCSQEGSGPSPQNLDKADLWAEAWSLALENLKKFDRGQNGSNVFFWVRGS